MFPESGVRASNMIQNKKKSIITIKKGRDRQNTVPAHHINRKGKTMARLHLNHTKTNKLTLREVYLFDNYLSFRSKGLQGMLYMFDQDLDFTIGSIADISTDTCGSVKTSFKELETLGYISRKMLRDKNGRFVTMEYTIHDRPKKRSIGGDIHC
ncbi:MAG: hypothetical protein Q4D15_05555 [Lachnospiraceae bacterium]|nr:hypothetical protein [Lachnospiraceae bacterium]